MTRAVALTVVVVTAAACGGGSGDDTPPPTGPITAHVDHYLYRFDLDSRVASVTMTATVETAGDCLTLPFRAWDLSPMRIDGVEVRSMDVVDDKVTACGTGYAAGAVLAIDAGMTIPDETLRSSDVGYSVSNDQWGNPTTYLVSWVGGCDLFGPCDNRSDQFARYTFEVTHAADVTVRCPGTITPGATMTRCDFTYMGGPTYSTFGVIGSKNWVVSNHDFSGIAVELYDRAGTGIAARIDDAYHGGFLDFMRAHFGPFPFGNELRILAAPTYWAGFEHPGNIVLSDGLGPLPPPTQINYKDPLAHILNHEIGHQWAGDQTTLADTYDFVWKEAMVEYLSYLYEEDTDPDAARKTREVWKAGSVGAGYYPVPEDSPLPALFDYYGDAYGPGPLILFKQIEVLSSRAQVMTALESLLGTQRAISVADVEDALAAATGLDLTAYFAAWAHGEGAPVWPRVSATYDAGTGLLTISQTNQSSGIKPCKFKVELGGADLADSVKVDVDTFTDGPDQDIAVTPAPSFPVTSVVVDPDDECLVFQATATAAPARPRPTPWLAPSTRTP
jgi:aminopeptidase N